MSLECNKKIKYLSSQTSFSAGRNTINDNFEALKGCLESVIEEVNNIDISDLDFDFPIIFPETPNPNIEYNLIYNAGKWFLTHDQTGGDDDGNVYWLLDGETLTIKERKQHIVFGEFIEEAGSEVVIENTGQLVILAETAP